MNARVKCELLNFGAYVFYNMPQASSQRLFDNQLFKNIIYVVLFGILSWALSLVGVGPTNLREIPLLICLIHIQRPVYVFVLCLFTLLNLPAGVPLWAVYTVHLIPLMIAWLCFRLIEKKKLPNILLGLSSLVITVGYYLLILIPLVVVAIKTFNGDQRPFATFYFEMLPLSAFEIISSALVISFYLMQFEIRRTLEYNNQNLSHEVERRTVELTNANNELLSLNEELKSSNESIKELNENLERMVKERTDKINDQLSQLSNYAHMNSHDVRAPLARMVGLMQLIKHKEIPADQKTELVDMLYDASNELDTLIKKMNLLLEKEIGL